MGQNSELFVPVQIIIDSGPYLKAGKPSLDHLPVNWGDIDPGEIYISEYSYDKLKENNVLPVMHSLDKKNTSSFYKIKFNKKDESKSDPFLYQKALIQGDNPPCFYCGDRRHLTAVCPSKHITEMTQFIDKLGYMPIEEINNLFFNYLNDNSVESMEFNLTRPHENISPSELARYAFFELKSVFQLRLLRTVWNIQEDNWNKIRQKKDDLNNGGLLWICMDCIRVSNFEQAESIIGDELSKKPSDYKIFCMAGLLSIEKNHFTQARRFLNKALELASRSTQKIYILFLLSRTYYLSDNVSKTKEMLRKIIRLSPYCTEALYLDILIKLKHGNKEEALDKIVKLINKNRDYYVYFLIDPDLSDYGKKIHSKLNSLYMEVRENVMLITSGVKDKLVSLEKLMVEGSKELDEARSLFQKIESLLKTESYFGYLDIIHYTNSLNNMEERIVRERDRKISKIVYNLKQRIKRCHSHMQRIP